MSERFDLVVGGGRVVSGAGVITADIGIGDGVVVEVGEIAASAAAEYVDASGLLVLPGAVDEHVHPIYLDDTGGTSVSAAHGGTTTLLHFAYAKPGTSLVEAVDEMVAEAHAGSYLDFGIHAGIFDAAVQADQLEAVAERGVRSFKMFMTYAAQGWMTDDHQLARVMDRVAGLGGLAMVHAENGPAIDYFEAEAAAGRRPGADAAATWLQTRPDVLEAEGVYRAISIAEVTGCDLFIPHVTSARALEVVQWARARGVRVVAETCPHYLTLTNDVVRERGALAKVGPPLRTQADVDALWEGLRAGTLRAIGSDHAPKKSAGDGNEELMSAGFGAPAVETLLPVVYDAAINGGRIGLPRLVQLVSENPARIFGLYPRKGTLQPGADADLVLWDPLLPNTITAESQHSAASYTLYEGRACTGGPRLVMSRGRAIVRDGELVAEAPAGRFLPTGEIDVLLDA